MVKSTKLKLLIFALLLGTFGFASNASAAGTELWGPERPTYKWDAPADHPVFNSITDNPQIQDERNFVRIKHAGDAGPHVDSVDIVPGERYEVYMYYHNNASASLNSTGVGFAQNVKMFAEMPEKLNAGDTALIKGTITWNTIVSLEKQSVWDTTQLVANDEVYLRYVPNSMKLYNQGYAKNGVALNGTDLFSEVGTYISHGDPVDDVTFLGLIPGCNEFAGYVTFEIQADFAKFYMEKNVKMSDDKNGEWKDTITVAPGDELQFSVKYHNEGTVLQEAVRLQDVLPEGLEYVKGSSYAIPHSEINYPPEFIKNTTNGYSEFPDGVFDEDGVVVGDFMPKTGFTFYYTVKVADADKFKECTTVLYNKASIVTANGAEFDKAKITVNKDCKTDPTPDPDPEDPDPEDPKPDDPKPEDPDPEEPDPEDPKPEEPEPAPDELPVAGPSGIIFGIVVVLGVCGSCFYLWKVKRTLNKVDAKADVMPEQPKDNE